MSQAVAEKHKLQSYDEDATNAGTLQPLPGIRHTEIRRHESLLAFSLIF